MSLLVVYVNVLPQRKQIAAFYPYFCAIRVQLVFVFTRQLIKPGAVTGNSDAIKCEKNNSC
jgi:hypothetical protein